MGDLVDYLRDKLDHADDVGREWRVVIRDVHGGTYPWETNPEDPAAALAQARRVSGWAEAFLQYRAHAGPWRDADR